MCHPSADSRPSPGAHAKDRRLRIAANCLEQKPPGSRNAWLVAQLMIEMVHSGWRESMIRARCVSGRSCQRPSLPLELRGVNQAPLGYYVTIAFGVQLSLWRFAALAAPDSSTPALADPIPPGQAEDHPWSASQQQALAPAPKEPGPPGTGQCGYPPGMNQVMAIFDQFL